MTDPTTKRPAAQVEYAKKAAELKGSNAEPSYDSWSKFSDAPTPPLTVYREGSRANSQDCRKPRSGNTSPRDCFDQRRLGATG